MMVDCPHLTHSVCIAQLDLEQLKRLGSGRPETSKQKNSHKAYGTSTVQTRNSLMLRKKQKLILDDGNWSCVECGTSQCPWLCLSCGLIHCGRYVNQDGLKHYKTYPNHSVSMDCYNYSVFCYQCDDFVACDTDDRKVASVRSSLQFYNYSRCDDHSYSSTKYESVPEPEEVIEISADDSPPSVFYDEGTEEELDTLLTNNKRKQLFFQRSNDSLEVQVNAETEVDAEREDSSRSENDRTQPVEFRFTSNRDGPEEKEDDSGSVPESEFTDRSEQKSRRASLSIGNTTQTTTVTQADCAFMANERVLRKRKRKESDSVSDESARSSISASASSYASGSSSSKEKQVSDSKNLRGLKNLGNTCFMNSVIQALNAIGVFRYFMSRLPLLEMDVFLCDSETARTPRYNTRSSLPAFGDKQVAPTFLSEELRKTLLEIASGTSASGTLLSAFGPDALLTEVWKLAPRFRGFQQHDSHEFLRSILDRMHAELKNCRLPDWLLSEICEGGVRLAAGSHFAINKRRNRNNKEERPCAISAIFGGTLQSQVTCLTCNTTSNKLDPFLDLSLDIYVPEVGARAVTVLLEDCMNRFFAKEELDSCEQYSCNKCKGKRPSTKQLFVKALPNVLCLHLKRFRWSHSHRGKLDNMVEFPVTGLDMKAFMSSASGSSNGDPSNEGSSMDAGSRSSSFSSCSSAGAANEESTTIYDLASLVVHHGSGVSSGHYTAYGLHDGQWYHFNDSSVKSCTEQAVTKQKAYLLFYVRRTHA